MAESVADIKLPDVSEKMERALTELTPAWVYFDDGMKIYDWCGEFLKRNKEFQADWKKAAANKRKLLESAKNEMVPQEGYSFSTPPSYDDLVHIEQEMDEMVRKHGINTWPASIERYDNPAQVFTPWGLHILASKENAKERAQFRASLFLKAGVNPRLKDNEEIMIIDFDSPIERYQDHLIQLYKARGLYREPGKKQADKYKTFEVEKYADYLKIYDLREWQLRNGAGSLKELAACAIHYIWRDGKHSYSLYEKEREGKGLENAKARAKAQYVTAKKFVEGEYREIMKYGILLG